MNITLAALAFFSLASGTHTALKALDSDLQPRDNKANEGQKHAFFNRSDSSPWHILVLRQIDFFLRSLGYLQGDPTIGIPADTAVALQKVRF